MEEASSPFTPPSPLQPPLRSTPPPAKESQQPKEWPPCGGAEAEGGLLRVHADLGRGWSWPWWRHC